ncbi:MAG: hypothetical protein K2Q06_00465, partial [Parvularculaceae bacterium]|nr:hypothetical protein [Parvularculaceae bacterium]
MAADLKVARALTEAPDSRDGRPFPRRLVRPIMRASFLFALAIVVAATGSAHARDNAVVDVRVGEKGNLTRIAVVCREACPIGYRAGGVFHLAGVRSALKIDLSKRSKNAEGVAFTPAAGGADLVVRSAKTVRSAAVRPCTIEGDDAACIDLEFGPPGSGGALRVAEAAAPTATRAEAPQRAAASPGRLRDPAIELAQFAAPERLDPPKGALEEAARVVKATATRPEPRAVIRADRAMALLGPDIDLLKEARAILGRGLGVAECEAAAARLRADAWALDAMVDVGLCTAGKGRL